MGFSFIDAAQPIGELQKDREGQKKNEIFFPMILLESELDGKIRKICKRTHLYNYELEPVSRKLFEVQWLQRKAWFYSRREDYRHIPKFEKWGEKNP